ncbi:MAG: phage portal protein [Rhodothermaceae bacterium]|nr:phage portal protein [Rhodothermaceae bacterium]MYF79849.1 phage portal protein [Chloroflexota bacterium]
MRWPFWKRPETRSSWADAVARLEHLLAGSDYSDVVKTAGAEIAAGIMERAFASATVTGVRELIAPALNPSMLAYVGRQITLHGASVHLIRTSSGKLELIPGQSWELYGVDPNPDTWEYDVYCPTPSGQFNKRVSSLDVVHVRAGCLRDTPWSGRSALRNAADLGTGHSRIESSLSKELKGAAGRLLPAPLDPSKNDADTTAFLKALDKLAGGPMMVETMRTGLGAGARLESKMTSDWEQKRIGPNPPESIIKLRNDLQASAGIALGIPAELLRADASSQARREAWRQLYFGTILPMARLLQNELRYKLESPELTIRFDELGASDLQGRGRAFKSLTDGGIDKDKAMRLCGLN